MHYTCPLAKTEKRRTNVRVWIQLAEPQYICISGSQVQQLAITIPQIIKSSVKHCSACAIVMVQQEWPLESLIDLQDGCCWRVSQLKPPKSPIKLLSTNSDTVAVQIRTPSLKAVLSHMLAKVLQIMCSSMIATACELDGIANWLMIETKWWVESCQRRSNAAEIWNMCDEVNLTVRTRASYKLVFSLSAKASGSFWWGFCKNAPECFCGRTCKCIRFSQTAALSRVGM